MNSKKLSMLALAAAVFAVACSDSTAPTRALQPAAPVVDLLPDPGYPFPSTPNDGLVTLCKISNVAGTFGFDVTVPGGGGATQISITVDPGEENTRVCHDSPLYNSAAGGSVAEFVTIVEDFPGANTSVDIDIDQYYSVNVNYGAVDPLGDTFNNGSRTATVVINDDLEKRVTFTNTFTPPETNHCTLTQGFWKNHLLDWPAPYDPSDPFYNSLKTYQQVITIEEDGNAYYILGRQFIAALLNIAAGASTTPAVDQAIIDADALFSGWPAGTTGPTNQQGRATWITLAGILDQFNRGLIGPGKCTG